MSLKELFGKKSNKVLSSTSLEDVTSDVESSNYLEASLEDAQRFVPDVDYSDPANFVKFGSAKKYYEDVIDNIVKTYPYDGSLFEKLDWHNSSSNFQNYFFENEYPRTTGYVNLGLNYGSLATSSNGYGNPSSKEYILFKGSMNLVTSSASTKLSKLFEKSNKYEPAKSRDYNLSIDGDNGLTLEFWLKKQDISGSERQIVFDLWNSCSFGNGDYGRFRVEVRSGSLDSFYFELMSGSAGIFDAQIGTSLGITDNEWHHYSLSLINTSSQISAKLYADGTLNEAILTGSSIGTVTGSYIGTIGSAVTSISGTYGALGWGKLSGSLDEVRYWKAKRTDKKTKMYWFSQVGGGSNSDDSNTNLGLYYKFNEGIINTASVNNLDAIVLDYSGRMSNGVWTGYSYTSRNTGSAIMEASASTSGEFLDPIVRSTHPLVVSLKSEKALTGSYYDSTNNAALINSFPTWIIEEDNGSLINLAQIISEYFDDLYLKIEALPRIKDAIYKDGKQLPFAARLLENVGFTTTDLFADIPALESILSRDENRNYEEKIYNIRNHIYQNIYNNIPYIYRSKGTEKSIRNLIRCFGVDDDLINLNLYANNVTYTFEDRYKYTTVRKKYIDFNDTDRFDGVVYQMTSSADSNSVSYISGNLNAGYLGTTLQVEAIMPKKFPLGSELFFRTDFITASIFGMHEADTADAGDTTWYGSDRANFRVYAIRPEEESKDAYFQLTSSYLGINLTSSLYSDVYNNEKWNLAVKIYHEKYPLGNKIEGTTTGNYIVEFEGINSILDSVQNHFILSASVSQALGEGHMSAAKRIYVGSHRTNFTGSLVVGAGNTDEFSDAKISSVRYWLTKLPSSVLLEHSKDALNYGVESAGRNVDAFNTVELQDINIPQEKTLVLHWDFDTVTGSDNGSGLPPANQSDAGFLVYDISSGSSSPTRYGWVGDITNKSYTGVGNFFLRNDTNVVQREYVYSAEHRSPETLNNDDLVSILSQDDEVFTRDTRPVNHYYVLEKSMYQSISKEMMKFFGTVKGLNNLIGEPSQRYNQHYKGLENLRKVFFENVENTPDFEKYIDFYKWIDDAINQMTRNLIPASANFSTDELSNIIESHVLERNKYWNKLPSIELKQEPAVVAAKTINELKYNWKYGHAPVSLSENENCYWWKNKAERDNKTGVDLNEDRSGIYNTSLQVLNRKFTTIYDIEVEAVTNIDFNTRNVDYVKQVVKFGSGAYLKIEASNLLEEIDCNDE